MNPSDLVGGSESESDPSESEPEAETELSEQQGLERINQSDQRRLRANDLFKQGRYEEAMNQYTRSRNFLNFICTSEVVRKKLEDSRILCQLNTAACALKLDDFDRTIEDCSAVLGNYRCLFLITISLELQPNNVKGLYRRGCAYVKKKKYSLAKIDLSKAAELSPEDETIRKLSERVSQKVNKLNDKKKEKEESGENGKEEEK